MKKSPLPGIRSVSLRCTLSLGLAILVLFNIRNSTNISLVFGPLTDDYLDTLPSNNTRFESSNETSKHGLVANPVNALLQSSNETSSRSKPEVLTRDSTMPIESSTPENRGLPTLDEITSISENYECPENQIRFDNIVLPRNVTHSNRRIPNVVHLTGKSRCMPSKLRDHILKWKLPDHSLYYHDDDAVIKLLDYSTNIRLDRHELVPKLTLAATCISTGATLSDFWRYLVLYHYGGIYTDLDNAPGPNYTADLIEPDIDAFFTVEGLGIMSQYYMAASKHHPILIQFLQYGSDRLLQTVNVMVNNPAKSTGPGAVKNGMIMFQRAANVDMDGYVSEGTYVGSMDPALIESTLSWHRNQGNHIVLHGDDPDYQSPSDFRNRTVTIIGNKYNTKQFVDRGGFAGRHKSKMWDSMNMKHYSGLEKTFKRTGRISCNQHATRMMRLVSTNGSFYSDKHSIRDLFPKYEYRKSDDGGQDYYYDPNTDEILVPNGTDVTTRGIR